MLWTKKSERRREVEGFTMIELIVVIGIIVLAAGMMTPSITDFFKNRQLQQVLRTMRSTINSARLKAVNERTRVRLVFFKEGVRVFDDRANKFVDEFFDPEGSPLADGKSWFVLGFYGDRTSTSLPAFREWEKTHLPKRMTGKESNREREKAAEQKKSRKGAERRIDLSGLPQIAFLRDGSVDFTVGVDVGTVEFKKEPPERADVMVMSAGNTTTCFIDIQMTGQNRSRLVLLDYTPTSAENYKKQRDEQRAASIKENRKKKRRSKRSRN